MAICGEIINESNILQKLRSFENVIPSDILFDDVTSYWKVSKKHFQKKHYNFITLHFTTLFISYLLFY